ncbi:uncharacterized protein TRIADDRAFT_28889 [Trichoplax adhaerens]|uniref:NIF3-like protein 1 n=1 Tax=Trichoplax adhaerens TaxID=10228 RepID=B3S4G2_TRIAD|nr:hypothetical protein TRIADDRAFT_28889 [Trichoplax adhaerens]EDV22458.1 hypothetical protein TRIADDRAFT_28889 [Trichoplax adhaerens]|eukprot:XP_002115002.1 hypothetical protein TRIADDRAFT_28889 [Trichoplax adhaerens]
MELQEVVVKLERFGPNSLAEKWDNVGLLVEPSKPHLVRKLMITNDLTEAVLKESIAEKADMILSYHPPIFAPLKKLTNSSVKERILVSAIENRIAVYSPHTIYDSLKGGVTDWLASCLGEYTTQPVIPFFDESASGYYKLEMYISKDKQHNWSEVLNNYNKENSVQDIIVSDLVDPKGCVKYGITCSRSGMFQILDSYHEMFDRNDNLQITKLSSKPILGTGSGRICRLVEPVSLQILIAQVKKHLNLSSLRLAADFYKPLSKLIRTVAVVAGAGGSLLKGVKADLYLTGEMSHHDVLAAVASGTCVLLCDHTNTERGYLFNKLKLDLGSLLDNRIEIITSKVDGDPLAVI